MPMLPDALYANVETPSPSLRRTCAFPSPSPSVRYWLTVNILTHRQYLDALSMGRSALGRMPE
jgi:hypothetical protein